MLHDFIEEDLELTVAVELDRLDVDGRKIRLVHHVRTLPDPWEVPEKESLGQQYADLMTEDAIVSRRRLMKLVRSDTSLSDGWRQRFVALVAGVIVNAFCHACESTVQTGLFSDLQDLLPDFDDFDEDILQDEAVEEHRLTGDDTETTGSSAVAILTDAAVETFESDEDDELSTTKKTLKTKKTKSNEDYGNRHRPVSHLAKSAAEAQPIGVERHLWTKRSR